MNIIKHESHEGSSLWVVSEIIEALIKKPNLLLCMASGHSPLLTAQYLVEQIQSRSIDYSKLYFIGLDEWVNMPPTDTGSCAYFFNEYIVKPLSLSDDQYHFFDGMAKDLELQCKKMDAIIKLHGNIDIMVVGIGMNGHIGFNEPGTSFSSLSHVAKLDDITKSIGQKYFEENKVLDRGITIGLGHLMETEKVILIANGQKKATVMHRAIKGQVDPSFPASIIQLHTNGYMVLDHEAATLLN